MSNTPQKNNEDIIYLPHHQSSKRPHMSMHDRAAQFGAFAALTGYDDAINETARLTDERIELDESVKEDINSKLVYIMENEYPSTDVTIVHFVPDSQKDGGKYVQVKGRVLKIDPTEKIVFMENDISVHISNIISLNIPDAESNLFCM